MGTIVGFTRAALGQAAPARPDTPVAPAPPDSTVGEVPAAGDANTLGVTLWPALDGDRNAGSVRRRSRFVLPGGGRWPWWGWALYAVVLGPFLLAALTVAALLRLVLPFRVQVWGFRRRRVAAQFVAWVVVVGGGTAAVGFAIVAPPVAWRSPADAVPTAAPTANPTALPTAVPTTAPTAIPTVAATQVPAAAPAPAALVDEPVPAAVPTAQPESTRPPAPAAVGRVAVANTGGAGVALRRTARWDDRIPGVAWTDRTVLTVLEDGVVGDDGAGGRAPWLRVRDPNGREGFVPGRYVVAAP
ncbi:MAG: hypothetical protein HY332_10905 [Chloroflexi bacterium]|nr:hypothetical protein [Chloroflexota bacterium]